MKGIFGFKLIVFLKYLILFYLVYVDFFYDVFILLNKNYVFVEWLLRWKFGYNDILLNCMCDKFVLFKIDFFVGVCW